MRGRNDSGAGGRHRTDDLCLTRGALCQLSYTGTGVRTEDGSELVVRSVADTGGLAVPDWVDPEVDLAGSNVSNGYQIAPVESRSVDGEQVRLAAVVDATSPAVVVGTTG